jgi:predicted transcriptional regulator
MMMMMMMMMMIAKITTAITVINCFVVDIKRKLDRLNSLWNEVQKATNDRGKSLEDALVVAERFWDELHNIMATLRDLQDSLNSQEPPAVEPAAIQQQQVALQEIRHEIDQVNNHISFLALKYSSSTDSFLLQVTKHPFFSS